MKISFIGAGSTVFAKNVLGDCILTPALDSFEIALFDIDGKRLNESYQMLQNINTKYNGKAKIKEYKDRRSCLHKANFVINAIQVGGYRPCTVTDFQIPKKYGLRQTIGDTLGIGGIFRALRTLPVLDDIIHDMERECPDALFLNYVNPMAILTGYLQRFKGIRTVGLCHSVQVCVPMLLNELNLSWKADALRYKIAGINHQAWLLYIRDENGVDLYPVIRQRAQELRESGAIKDDLVRLEMMNRFGYYVTESSIHCAEYVPYFIKNKYPELLKEFNIPLDEYPRRCEKQIADWEEQRELLIHNKKIEHIRSNEYASRIIEAIVTDHPYRFNGNVINNGLIENLPKEACVEVPCFVDKNGVSACGVGRLPEQLAALNRTNINVQLMAIEAYQSRKMEDIYRAAYLDPHTASELSMDEIRSMCDELVAAHGGWMPAFLHGKDIQSSF